MSPLEPVRPAGPQTRSMNWSRIKGRYLLALAAILHLLVSVSIIVTTRAGLMSSVFDQNGLGTAFASDTRLYFNGTVQLAWILKAEGWTAWFNASFPSHTKFYSLSMAAFGPLVGYNILAVEPVNLCCYLAILVVVFNLGRQVFSPGVGLVAAAFTALWPSLLLHTTQFLKDPQFIACLLSLVLLGVTWLARTLSISQGLISSALTCVTVIVIWLVKPDSWELVLIVGTLSVTFLLIKAIKARTIASGNAIAAASLVIALVVVPFSVPRYHNTEPLPFLAENAERVRQQETYGVVPGERRAIKKFSGTANPIRRLRERLTWARYLYDVSYPVKSSNIDEDVLLESWGEVFRYLPRAAVIGMFAPFPDLWLGSGAQVGRSGRLVAGAETLLMYVGYLFVAFALWMRRRNLVVWFLVAIACCGAIALSLVVVNMGTLYRLRFPFWILLIIVATDGAFALSRTLRARKSNRLVVNLSAP